MNSRAGLRSGAGSMVATDHYKVTFVAGWSGVSRPSRRVSIGGLLLTPNERGASRRVHLQPPHSVKPSLRAPLRWPPPAPRRATFAPSIARGTDDPHSAPGPPRAVRGDLPHLQPGHGRAARGATPGPRRFALRSRVGVTPKRVTTKRVVGRSPGSINGERWVKRGAASLGRSWRPSVSPCSTTPNIPRR